MVKHLPPSESKHLASMWSGEFGDAYVERNREAGNTREQFWHNVLNEFGVQTVLEVGGNIGANLRWIAAFRSNQHIYGVEINLKSLNELRRTLPDINAI
jgi:hypothetical protein